VNPTPRIHPLPAPNAPAVQRLSYVGRPYAADAARINPPRPNPVSANRSVVPQCQALRPSQDFRRPGRAHLRWADHHANPRDGDQRCTAAPILRNRALVGRPYAADAVRMNPPRPNPVSANRSVVPQRQASRLSQDCRRPGRADLRRPDNHAKPRDGYQRCTAAPILRNRALVGRPYAADAVRILRHTTAPSLRINRLAQAPARTTPPDPPENQSP